MFYCEVPYFSIHGNKMSIMRNVLMYDVSFVLWCT